MPSCGARLKARKPLPATYPHTLDTLGDHLRKRRLDLGLRQTDVAEQLKVDETTIANWELNRMAPALAFIPKIIRVLGYPPFRTSGGLPKRLRAFRQASGLSQKALARLLGVDPSTVLHWERGTSNPGDEHWTAITQLLPRSPAI